MPFNPGPGVGGHCIPIDPSYLAHVANRVGVPATFIKRANEVNLAMPAYVVKRVVTGCGGSIKDKKVVVVGVSYKSNVADTRETPAAAVIVRQLLGMMIWLSAGEGRLHRLLRVPISRLL
jgi:UDP-N-acetyl-D-glucosamine dehydrogenase